jgi:hypothetical protein
MLALGNDAEAEQFIQAALPIFETTLPPDESFYLARCRMNLANLFHNLGRTVEARAMGNTALRAVGFEPIWHPGM